MSTPSCDDCCPGGGGRFCDGMRAAHASASAGVAMGFAGGAGFAAGAAGASRAAGTFLAGGTAAAGAAGLAGASGAFGTAASGFATGN